MLTLEKIKSEFSFIDALTGETQSYHNTDTFKGHGEFCDIYFVSVNKEVKAEQIEVYNNFKMKYKNYLQKIDHEILNSLNSSEQSKETEIKNAILYFEVIQISQGNPKYDLVLVCSKTYKRFMFLKKDITFRVEFKNENIISLQRTSDSTKDNE